MSKNRFDLVIIGGGVAGLVTASGASQLGAKVALIDKESLGGDCLHWGCVPTKRLVETARVVATVRRAGEFGIETDGVKVDFAKVMQSMRDVQQRLAKADDPERFRKMGVEVIFGSGKFLDPKTFEIVRRGAVTAPNQGGETPPLRLKAKKFLIATGSRPVMLPIPGLEQAGALNNITALRLKELPKSIVILGAGPIGLEYAQVFARLGSNVTVVEKAEQILPREDREVAERLEKILTEEGIKIFTAIDIDQVDRRPDGRCVITGERRKGGKFKAEGEEVMLAIGRAPNIEGLGLEAAGVKFDRRRIFVNETMRTTQKHIFAAGDVTGLYPFTHMAEYQAGLVVSNLFPLVKRKADYRVVPWVTYVDPELGRVGLTEAEAVEQHGKKNVAVYRFSFEEVDRAVIEGEGRGLIKIICDRKNRLLGAHVLGPRGGELLHEYVLAMKAGLAITQISQTVHVYPTLAQAVKRTADQYYRKKLFQGAFPLLAKILIKLFP